MVLWLCFDAHSQQNIAPVSVNTDHVVSVGDEKAALTVRGKVVMGKYLLDPDLDGKFDENRTDELKIPFDMNESALLWVEGDVVASLAYWTSEDWGDNVFDSDYELPGLSELDDFIKKNNHLPGVPSAKDIKESGYSAKFMNKVLITEIEELTLYSIQQENKINLMKNKLNNHIDKLSKSHELLVQLGEELDINSLSTATNGFPRDLKSMLNIEWKFEPLADQEFASDQIIGTMTDSEVAESQVPGNEQTYAKMGANTDHVEEETVFNIRGKTVIFPEGMESLPDLSQVRAEDEEDDFSMYVFGDIYAQNVTSRDLFDKWDQFSFNDEYQLMPLEKVNDFIVKNGHLPQIPSAIEVKNKGYEEFEMKEKFMTKIKDLHLYTVQQQHHIQQLQAVLIQLEDFASTYMKGMLDACNEQSNSTEK